ncbi:ABC transporter ATP-binding protein [Desulfitobacterium sp. AusDCA]|uniref:ABC transporter ATP-binding protein n=1 Tax=Desulfitobacterium sp. AusDCA TaxID=3240383 RepID=UPI003DA7995F
MKVIECENLTKSFGRFKALDGLSFEIEENKITGLIGRNGAGKTTLLKLIAGYLRPTGGELKVFSQHSFNNLSVAGNMIFVDENMAFPESFTLEDILAEAAPFYPNWDSRLAEGLFDYSNLNPQIRHSRLSKGSKSLFNCIIGIASHCPLTLFDEPTTGMDSAVRKDFYRALLKDYLEYPRTVLLSSHLLNEVEDILEDVLLLKQGRKCLHLPIDELKEWAMGLRGNAQVILGLLEGEEIIHQEEFAKDNVYAVIKRNINSPMVRDFIQEGSGKAKQSGVELMPVSIDNLFIYLTEKSKGGIDDVFKRS